MLNVLCLMPVIAQAQINAEAGKVTYSDEELKSFIIANAGLYQLQQQAAAQMQNLESDQQKQEIMQVANQQMLQVLQQVGLTADEYNTMGKSIQSDVQLQEKINTIASDLFQQEEQQ
ncbi:MAG TPA: DUF4168 domain-containing protein [Nitrosomonas sp.]|nr:DUF4168 domain-containing protein [Nitrosomonas sp.]